MACTIAWQTKPVAAAEADGTKLVDTATAYMRIASGLHIEETISIKQGSSHFAADIAGDDFDIVVNSSSRSRMVRGKSWASENDGKSWHSDPTVDRKMFDLLRAPILGTATATHTKYIIAQTAKAGDYTTSLVELRADPPLPPAEAPPSEMTVRLWIVESPGGKTWIEHFSGPVIFMGGVVMVDAHYSKVDEVDHIDTPPTN